MCLLDTQHTAAPWPKDTAPLAPPQAVDAEHVSPLATASGAWRGGKSQTYSRLDSWASAYSHLCSTFCYAGLTPWSAGRAHNHQSTIRTLLARLRCSTLLDACCYTSRTVATGLRRARAVYHRIILVVDACIATASAASCGGNLPRSFCPAFNDTHQRGRVVTLKVRYEIRFAASAACSC